MALGFQVGILFTGMVFKSTVLLLARVVRDVYYVEIMVFSHPYLLHLLYPICGTPLKTKANEDTIRNLFSIPSKSIRTLCGRKRHKRNKMHNSRLHNERLPRLHNVPPTHPPPNKTSLVIKTITLPLAIASGLSVGKEGPSVHVAVCAGHTISRLFPLHRSALSMREIYAASSAAGVAVAFGAPIGGVLFSLEEMVSFGGNVSPATVGRGFLMALVACMCVGGMDPFWTGGLVMFEVRYERDWRFFEVLFSFRGG